MREAVSILAVLAAMAATAVSATSWAAEVAQSEAARLAEQGRGSARVSIREKERAEAFVQTADLPADTVADKKAKALFDQALREALEADALPWSGPGHEGQLNVAKKGERSKAAIESFEKVCEGGSEAWCLLAKYEQGHVVERTADSLVAQQCPPDLFKTHGSKGCQELHGFLSGHAKTMLETARARYEAAVAKCESSKLTGSRGCTSARLGLRRVTSWLEGVP